MKKFIIFCIIIIFLSPNIISAEYTESNLDIIKYYSLESGNCSTNASFVIVSNETMTFNTGDMGNMGVNPNKDNKINFNTIRISSSNGPLNFSILRENETHIIINPFEVTISPIKPFYYSIYFEEEKCIKFKPEWSLLRIPIYERVSEQKGINVTVILDSRLGYNNNSYIFLIGYPFPNTGYMNISNVSIISEDPIKVNFESKNEILKGFIDLYFFPKTSLIIEQTDSIDLKNSKIKRKVKAVNKYSKRLFFFHKGNKIEIFYIQNLSNGEIPEQIDPSDGYKNLLDEEENLNISKSPCLFFSDSAFFYPFECINIRGEMDINNYLTSNSDSISLDYNFNLKYEKIDNFKVVDSNRCISLKGFSIPPIQVVKNIKQPSIYLQINDNLTTDCSATRLIINHNNLSEYISPKLLNISNDYLENDRGFKKVQFGLNVPASSVSIKFFAKLTNYFYPGIFWFIIILLFSTGHSLIFYIKNSALKKRNSPNKSNLVKWRFSFLYVFIFEIILGVLSWTPDGNRFNLLTISPFLGLFLGYIFHKIYRLNYLKAKVDKLAHSIQRFLSK